MEQKDPLLRLAERVVEEANKLGIETAIIGAAALAVHGYQRATLDLDLASAVDPTTKLRELDKALLGDPGWHVFPWFPTVFLAMM